MKSFDDITWSKHKTFKGGLQGLLKLDSGKELSIIAGAGAMSNPGGRLLEQELVLETEKCVWSFEVAIFDSEQEFIGEPAGWVSRDGINSLIIEHNE